MTGKPRHRLAAITTKSEDPERPGDPQSVETWQRLCDTADSYRQGEIEIWEVVTAASEFVKASGDTTKASQLMSTLPRPPTR